MLSPRRLDIGETKTKALKMLTSKSLPEIEDVFQIETYNRNHSQNYRKIKKRK